MTMICINLPVADLPRAKAFYVSLGYSINPNFTDDNAAAVVINDSIVLMLLVRPFFQTFIGSKDDPSLGDRTICDTETHVETLLALSVESREAVDQLLTKALDAGARERGRPQEYPFMFGRRFSDLDGHTFEVFYMNEAAAAAAT